MDIFQVIYIRGTNEDGVQYWTGSGWSSNVIGALEMRDYYAAMCAIEFLKAQNTPLKRLHPVIHSKVTFKTNTTRS